MLTSGLTCSIHVSVLFQVSVAKIVFQNFNRDRNLIYTQVRKQIYLIYILDLTGNVCQVMVINFWLEALGIPNDKRYQGSIFKTLNTARFVNKWGILRTYTLW